MYILRGLAVFLLLSACSKPETAPVPPDASARPSPPVSRRASALDTPTAFDLALSREGATLVWAPADASAGAIVAVNLDAGGNPTDAKHMLRGAEEVRGDVADLAATWVKYRLALAWLERAGGKARVRATWAASRRPMFELGAAWFGPRTARGNLVLAARGDHALAFARGAEAPCIEAGRHGCFGFDFHELREDRAVQTGLPLSVPVPCVEGSTVLAVAGSRWHYGVCTDSGKQPVTTLFTIQTNPEYARADRLLEGCEPAGMLAWDGAAWLVADCQGQRRAARVGHENEPAEYLDLRGLELACAGGVARLRAAGFELVLDEPRASLQALLGAELAPRGARAVWTGRALLVASTSGDELRVRRHACAGDRWVATDLGVR